jgi:hypothetical protein
VRAMCLVSSMGKPRNEVFSIAQRKRCECSSRKATNTKRSRTRPLRTHVIRSMPSDSNTTERRDRMREVCHEIVQKQVTLRINRVHFARAKQCSPSPSADSDRSNIVARPREGAGVREQVVVERTIPARSLTPSVGGSPSRRWR